MRGGQNLWRCRWDVTRTGLHSQWSVTSFRPVTSTGCTGRILHLWCSSLPLTLHHPSLLSLAGPPFGTRATHKCFSSGYNMEVAINIQLLLFACFLFAVLYSDCLSWVQLPSKKTFTCDQKTPSRRNWTRVQSSRAVADVSSAGSICPQPVAKNDHVVPPGHAAGLRGCVVIPSLRRLIHLSWCKQMKCGAINWLKLTTFPNSTKKNFISLSIFLHLCFLMYFFSALSFRSMFLLISLEYFPPLSLNTHSSLFSVQLCRVQAANIGSSHQGVWGQSLLEAEAAVDVLSASIPACVIYKSKRSLHLKFFFSSYMNESFIRHFCLLSLWPVWTISKGF